MAVEMHARRNSNSATDIGATPHCGARFLSVEKEIDEISATGGHRFLSHGLPLRSRNQAVSEKFRRTPQKPKQA